jgi:serine phosphatase RsbU (regulator of sigma subunit)/CHASE2 domain-containing sensor protein
LKRLLALLSQIWRAKKGRPVTVALLAAFALLLSFPDMQPFKSARLALFDQYQNLSPRQPQSQPAVIVEIDEATLGALGQWPWPRNYFAALIDAIAALKPAAVGLDIIMPEPDHASPQAVAESRPDLPENVRNTLIGAASNDHLLATSLAGAPTVLGAAGFPFHTSETLEGLRTNPIEVRGNNPLPWLNAYPYVLASLPEFQSAARGQALLSSDPENGVVRRAAVLSSINSAITPGLSLEMLRIAHAAPNIVVETSAHGVEAANIGAQRIPLQSNGEVWVHFDKPSRQRYISALSLLKNEVPPERISGKMVLVGLTGLGLQDVISTPLGDRRPGVEVHAQLIESFEDGHFLTRPWWLHWVEMGVLVGGGLLLIWALPNAKPRNAARRGNAAQRGAEQRGVQRSTKQVSATPYATRERRNRDRASGIKPSFAAMLGILLFVLLFGAGMALFRWAGLLFDAASLFIALSTVFGSLLSSNFLETDHQRNNAERALQNQRIKAAQLAGELDAARRIQLGTLPVAATAFPGETRFEIDAMLEPARQVGGDLYDFFMIDARRLFFVIGDVSGKGLPASLFMVVTKALAKSAALRGNDGIGAIVTMANTEMARENPEMLFVTAVAGILDVENGTLELVNAGHDAPWRIGANGNIESVNGDGGPPLCVLEDFSYPVEHLQLAVGDTLFLLTDGITEAMNANKELYSMARVSAVLDRVAADQHPTALVTALREDVRTFVGDTEASDDLTLLVLRWLGSDGHRAQ